MVIEPSPTEKDMIWAGTDDGRVQLTQNGGQSWADVSPNIAGLPKGSWIVQIKASNKNKGEALLVANDYRRFNYTPYAFRTRDYGKTWQRIVSDKDVKSYALCIIEDPIEKNLLFLGTDDGLYISIDAGNSWKKYTNGFPTVSVKDLIIHPRENDLVIATFGRAAWVLDDIIPLREIAGNSALLNQDLKLFNPPTAYLAAYQQPTGSRFGADAIFNGENRQSGALLKFYFKSKEIKKEEISTEKNKKNKKKDKTVAEEVTAKKVEEDELPKAEDKEPEEETEKVAEDEKGKSKDSLYLKIYDGDRIIRTLKRKIPDSSGIYVWRWNLDESGSDRPSRSQRESKNEPGGITVKPNTYRVEINYEGTKSENSIKVESDPRLPVSQKAIDENYTASKKLENFTQVAADAVEQLVESKKTVDEFNDKLKEAEKADLTSKDKYKDEIKNNENVSKKIDSLIEVYIGKVDKRQGITRNAEITVMNRINTANGYVESRPNGLTNTENTLILQAENELKEALSQTNLFFEKNWTVYQAKMESLEISPFKKVETFTIKN